MRAQQATSISTLPLVLLVACGPGSDPGSDPSPNGQAAEDRPELRPGASSPKHLELDPPEARARSPYTGWTRAHYEAVFARLLLGFVEHRSPAGARTRYPGGEGLPAAMEGAIRMLPALGAWLACPCNPDRVIVEGREIDVLALARAIVVAGTDPRSRDYWHPIDKGWDQRKVEAATVAEFLLRSRERVWARLDPFEQGLIMGWLRASDEPLAANWLTFQITRDTARAALGRTIDEADLAHLLELIEADYEGEGFYRDGGVNRFDWYNAFVIHPQLTLWRAALEHDDPEARARAERLAAHTRAFLRQLPYLMDAQGRVPPIGRSLAYRSAVLAALHASILAGDEFLAPGLARRMSSGNLRFHLDAGMFDEHDVLTRGYHGEEPGVLENYLRPGSQYFMTHALAVLALPPEHPFWTATEQPLPADLGDFVHALPRIGWMVEHDREGAGLVLHNARSSMGKVGYHERYKKLDYAPLTWFAQADEARHPYDALVVSAARQGFETRRSAPYFWAVAPGFAWTRYAMHPEAAPEDEDRPKLHWISTALLHPLRAGELAGPSVRVSCVFTSPSAPARAYEGSPAILAQGPGRGEARPVSEGAQAEDRPWWYLDAEGTRPGSAAVLLAGLAGWTRAGPRLDWPGSAEHVLGGEASWVGLGVDAPFDRSRCFASMLQVSAASFDPRPVLDAAPEVELLGSRANVRWPEGALAWVELSQIASERVLELGPSRLTGPLRAVTIDAPDHERGDPQRVVAVGVRSIADAEGAWLKTVTPRSLLACERAPARLRCETDGPIAVRLAGEGEPKLRFREPGWSGEEAVWTAPASPEIDAEGWIAVEPPAAETTTMIFELSLG